MPSYTFRALALGVGCIVLSSTVLLLAALANRRSPPVQSTMVCTEECIERGFWDACLRSSYVCQPQLAAG